jgi:hypothetical protein
MVLDSYAIVDPGAMMVEALNTSVTNAAMSGP